MFWSRWHLAWLGVCLTASFVWAGVLLVRIVALWPRWPNLPGVGGPHIVDVAAFLLVFFTLPTIALYMAGFGIVQLVKLTMKLERQVGKLFGRSRTRPRDLRQHS